MNTEQIRTLFLYEFKLGHKAADTCKFINTAFPEEQINERTVQRWFQKFKSGDFDLANEDRGRPASKVNNAILKQLVESNPTTTIRDLAGDLEVHHSTIKRHLNEIGKVKKLDEWVPHNLTEAHKVNRVQICLNHLKNNQKASFLNRIVTCDEKWVLYDNRKRSGSWLDADQPPEKSAKPDLHPKKVMVTVWWGINGIIHYSFLKRGETINAERYCRQLEAMHTKLIEKQPALVNRHGVILLHDNARPHVSVQTVNFTNELGYEILPHPPYSPDLSPTDYHLFKHFELLLREKNYNNRL